MRPLRKAVLAALLSSVTLLSGVGQAPAASAATTAIEWQADAWDGRIQPRQSIGVCPADGESFEVGQTVTAQVRLGGAWVDRGSVRLSELWTCAHFWPADLVGSPGAYSLRALTRTSPSAPLLEATTSVTFAVEQSSVYWDAHMAQALYFHTGNPDKVVPAQVTPARGQRVELQRRSGSRWVTVSTAIASPGAAEADAVHVPVPTRAGNATYRLVNRATAWSTRSVSQRFLIHQTDSARNGRYIAAARRHIARHCPKTPIYVDIPEVKASGGSNTIGRAWSWAEYNSQSGWLRTAIALRSGLTGKKLQHVALHECAHVVQYRALVEDKQELEYLRAWRLWPRVGEEGQADCMAHHYSRTVQYMAYVRSCSPRQMDSARRMWRTYGPKYQAAFYRWGPSSTAVAAAVPGADDPVTTVVSSHQH